VGSKYTSTLFLYMIANCKRENCIHEFTAKSNKMYCSRECKQKASDKRNNRTNLRKRPYIIHKKGVCEECGFIPVNSCQLDVDHLDGNNKNNEVSNLQTLCANCHRLKTYTNRDWEVRNKHNNNNNKLKL